MFVELHMLQNFAPSSLNRDDTGSPKECEFGGYRRARISSQSIKRAVRMVFYRDNLIDSTNRASRSRRFVKEITGLLVEAGKLEDEARKATIMLLGSAGIMSVTRDEEDLSEYLLFLGDQEVTALRDYCLEHWDDLLGAYVNLWGEDGSKTPGKDAVRRGAPEGAAKAVEKILDGGKAADLALFGRMIADLPEKNIDAASQVAHAISTNRVVMDFDYYTAMDDLKPDDIAGADMIGTIGFNSACFYRYSNVDMEQLIFNLDRDEELARKTLDAYLRASIAAIPTGKQNSMAAHNPPSFVFVVVRESGLWNLANAFLEPVSPNRDADLVQRSIRALDTYWASLSNMYGDRGIIGKWAASLNGNEVEVLKEAMVTSVNQIIESVQGAISFRDSEN